MSKDTTAMDLACERLADAIRHGGYAVADAWKKEMQETADRRVPNDAMRAPRFGNINPR